MSSNSETSSTPICSICLDPIITGNGRATATLSCSHLFHLDCIGSEFNYRGVMQCPNCRVVEQGNWQFGSGDFLGDITNDEEEDQENIPNYVDTDHTPRRNYIWNESIFLDFMNRPRLPTPPPLCPGMSQLPQIRPTHHIPVSNSMSIIIADSSGHDGGITLGSSSHHNFYYPSQADQQAGAQTNGLQAVQNIQTVQQQQSPSPSGATVQVRAPMSVELPPPFVNRAGPRGPRLPPRPTLPFSRSAQPSQTEGDDLDTPMLRFL